MPDTEKIPVTEDTAPTTARSPFTRLLFIFGLAALVLVADQLTKLWAQAALTVGEAPRPLIGELIQLRLIYNPGAALSIASGMTWVLTLLSVGVVVFIIMMARKIVSTAWAIALGLVLGGAIGNLGDRLFRAPGFPNGHVVDFIDYGPFIGNVADIAIVVAAVLIAILAFLGIGPDGRAADAAVRDAAGADDAPAADRTAHDTGAAGASSGEPRPSSGTPTPGTTPGATPSAPSEPTPSGTTPSGTTPSGPAPSNTPPSDTTPESSDS